MRNFMSSFAEIDFAVQQGAPIFWTWFWDEGHKEPKE